jgi:hypothetical protein
LVLCGLTKKIPQKYLERNDGIVFAMQLHLTEIADESFLLASCLHADEVEWLLRVDSALKLIVHPYDKIL